MLEGTGHCPSMSHEPRRPCTPCRAFIDNLSSCCKVLHGGRCLLQMQIAKLCILKMPGMPSGVGMRQEPSECTVVAPVLQHEVARTLSLN
jgi:hypothetical protein